MSLSFPPPQKWYNCALSAILHTGHSQSTGTVHLVHSEGHASLQETSTLRTTPNKCALEKTLGTSMPSPLGSDLSQFTPACQAPVPERCCAPIPKGYAWFTLRFAATAIHDILIRLCFPCACRRSLGTMPSNLSTCLALTRPLEGKIAPSQERPVDCHPCVEAWSKT